MSGKYLVVLNVMRDVLESAILIPGQHNHNSGIFRHALEFLPD